MRILVQRVESADVTVDGRMVAVTGKGMLLFVGIGQDDTIEDIERLAKKVINLRIFEDENGKINLNIKQAEGEVLSVSQFTLYADTKRGNRPGFDQAADPETAKEYWEKFNGLLRKEGMKVEEGIFAANMQIGLVNDGPVTIMLDSQNPS
jgi:D-tyrosyl-tRNA(Tyr) deacylase